MTDILPSSIPGGLVITSPGSLNPLHFDPDSPLCTPSPILWNSFSFKLALGRIQTTIPMATRAEPRQESPVPAAVLMCSPLLKLTAWVSTKNRSPSPNDSILWGVEYPTERLAMPAVRIRRPRDKDTWSEKREREKTEVVICAFLVYSSVGGTLCSARFTSC